MANAMDAPGGPQCACGRPSHYESGRCAIPHDIVWCEVCMNDKIADWHCQDSATPLYHWLGMSWSEYEQFVQGKWLMR